METREQLSDNMLNASQRMREAQLTRSINRRPGAVRVVKIDLTTARGEGNPLILSIPFQSVFVRAATSALTTIKIAMHSDESDQVQNAVPLLINDSIELPQAVAKCALIWDAQASASVTLVFFMEGIFRSGSQLSISSGSVSIGTGTSCSPATPVQLTAAAQKILSSDATRKLAIIQEIDGGTFYIGGTSTITDKAGALPGILVGPNGNYEWDNSGELYACGTGRISINVFS